MFYHRAAHIVTARVFRAYGQLTFTHWHSTLTHDSSLLLLFVTLIQVPNNFTPIPAGAVVCDRSNSGSLYRYE